MASAHMVVIDGIRYRRDEAEAKGLIADAETRGGQVLDRPASDRARTPESATAAHHESYATDAAHAGIPAPLSLDADNPEHVAAARALLGITGDDTTGTGNGSQAGSGVGTATAGTTPPDAGSTPPTGDQAPAAGAPTAPPATAPVAPAAKPATPKKK